MDNFNNKELINNEVITNQRSIDKLLGLNFDDNFYTKLFNQITKEYSKIKDYELSIVKLYSYILYTNTHDLIFLITNQKVNEEYKILENIFFTNFKDGIHNENRLAYFWYLYTNPNSKKTINLENFDPTDYTLKESERQKALLFIFSSSLSGASYDFDNSETSELFRKLYISKVLNIENFCVYIDLVGMYQDFDQNNFNLTHTAIRKTLTLC